ncbi:hypothetical protein [Roseibium album]|uniref:hypothetical protein n=1 Tax=Roseibium album TaxID=311410 RepID=UPI0032984D79
MISNVVSTYRTAAWWRLLKQYPELRKELMKKQTDVKSAVEVKRQSRKDGPDLKTMLEEMGY